MHKSISSSLYDSTYLHVANSRFKSGFLKNHSSALLYSAGRISPKDKVLEIGSNTGEFIKLFIQKTHSLNIVGIDINKTAVRFAQKMGFKVLLGSAEKLPLKNNSIDLVFSQHVFEHLPHPSLAFKELERVLKPGGKAIIITPPNYFGFETILVAHQSLPPQKRNPVEAYNQAKKLHPSTFGHPFGGAKSHVQKILAENKIRLTVSGKMRPSLWFSNLLIIRKPDRQTWQLGQ